MRFEECYLNRRLSGRTADARLPLSTATGDEDDTERGAAHDGLPVGRLPALAQARAKMSDLPPPSAEVQVPERGEGGSPPLSLLPVLPRTAQSPATLRRPALVICDEHG